MNTKLQAELDREGTDLLIEVMRAARSFSAASWSDPRSDDLRRTLHIKVFQFDQWEAGSQLVPVALADEPAFTLVGGNAEGLAAFDRAAQPMPGPKTQAAVADLVANGPDRNRKVEQEDGAWPIDWDDEGASYRPGEEDEDRCCDKIAAHVGHGIEASSPTAR